MELVCKRGAQYFALMNLNLKLCVKASSSLLLILLELSLCKVWTCCTKAGMSESDRKLTFHFPNINRTHQKLISTIVLY